MDYTDMILLDTPLHIFIKKSWDKHIQQGEKGHRKMMMFFKDLLSVGCDYYELISLYSDFQLIESDIEVLAGFCPCPTQILSISQKNIRLALPHWTPSRYHTAPISQVVESIYQLLLCDKTFLKVYNSNLNLKNRKVYNDRYILLISNCKSLIMDINRRNIIQFY